MKGIYLKNTISNDKEKSPPSHLGVGNCGLVDVSRKKNK